MKFKNLFTLFLLAGCSTTPLNRSSSQLNILWVPDSETHREPANTQQDAISFYRNSIQRAQVWFPPDMNHFSIEKSDYPTAQGLSYHPGEEIICRFDASVTAEKKKASGKTRKFWCNIDNYDKIVKIKYFPSNPDDNKEVFSGAVSTRLFRALGFMANRAYSVSVNCPNCPDNPWDVDNKNQKMRVKPFSPALIEFKPAGKSIIGEKEGWPWPDLDLIDPSLPSAIQETMKTHRGALRLLAAFVQHSDNKTEQQSLICLDSIKTVEGKQFCDKPVMYVHDLGATWGGGGKFSTNAAKMSFNDFVDQCMWDNADSNPIANLNTSLSGSFGDKQLKSISENSRQFLLGLMKEFASQPVRVRQLFEVAQLDKMHELKNEKITIDHWVTAFNIKLNELNAKTCFKDQRKKLKEAAKKGLPYAVSLN